jgi:hypothetical protein
MRTPPRVLYKSDFNAIFLTEENRIFKKFFKSADFFYSEVFGYGENEFEGIFEFGSQERVELEIV